MKISACMIVRDEEELLAECLESINSFVDEIIVVDTGSVDKTIAIAKQFKKVKLFKRKWTDDFAAARNYSIGKAKGDWIFIIDADERLDPESVSGLSDFIVKTEADIISLGVYSLYANAPSSFLTSTRLFRAKHKFRYTGIIHNQLAINKNVKDAKTDFRINHLGYDLSKEKMLKKHERSRDLIEKQLEEDPDNAFALMNLAQLYRIKDDKFNIGSVNEIIETCFRAAELTDPRHYPNYYIHLQSMDLLAWSLLFAGKVDDAMAYALQVLKLKDDFVDTIFLMGFCHFEKQLYEKAIFWFNRYIKVHEKISPSTQHDNVQFCYLGRQPDCLAWMGKSALRLKQHDKAVNYSLSALKLKPTMTEAYETLEVMYSRKLINDNEMNLAKTWAKRKEEMPANYYDKIFKNPYNTSRYDKIYSAISATVFQSKGRVLEIGCGTGVLAQKLQRLGIKYRGFDFSQEAIKTAIAAGATNISQGDIYDSKQFINHGPYDTIVATEVLEHVRDLEVLALVPEGKRLLITIPNFDDPAHLRFYKTPRVIAERFGHLIDIKEIKEFNHAGGATLFLIDGVKKPPITKERKDGTNTRKVPSRELAGASNIH